MKFFKLLVIPVLATLLLSGPPAVAAENFSYCNKNENGTGNGGGTPEDHGKSCDPEDFGGYSCATVNKGKDGGNFIKTWNCVCEDQGDDSYVNCQPIRKSKSDNMSINIH